MDVGRYVVFRTMKTKENDKIKRRMRCCDEVIYRGGG